MSAKTQFKSLLSDYLNDSPSSITVMRKGRVGLFGLLKALDVTDGDEVILPAYTCVVVPNAIIYLNAKPIYVDIDPYTYNMDPKKIREKISPKTKVIIAQNTYGLSSELDEINQIAHEYRIAVIEDCTHGFGGMYNNILNGKHVNAAFFSTQWNKMFSTGIGGFVYAKDLEIASAMNKFEQSLQPPGMLNSSILQIQIWLKDLLGYSFLYWNALKLYRYLSSKNIVTGSSSYEELTDTQIPGDYLSGFSEVQARRACSELAKINKNISHRKKCAAKYDETLKNIGIAPTSVPGHIFHTYTKYPVLAKNRNFLFSQAEKANIPLHDWFISPIHPIMMGHEKWHFYEDQYPIASKVAKHVVNLPTDLNVSDSLLNRTCDFIKANKKEFLNYSEI